MSVHCCYKSSPPPTSAGCGTMPVTPPPRDVGAVSASHGAAGMAPHRATTSDPSDSHHDTRRFHGRDPSVGARGRLRRWRSRPALARCAGGVRLSPSRPAVAPRVAPARPRQRQRADSEVSDSARSDPARTRRHRSRPTCQGKTLVTTPDLTATCARNRWTLPPPKLITERPDAVVMTPSARSPGPLRVVSCCRNHLDRLAARVGGFTLGLSVAPTGGEQRRCALQVRLAVEPHSPTVLELERRGRPGEAAISVSAAHRLRAASDGRRHRPDGPQLVGTAGPLKHHTPATR